MDFLIVKLSSIGDVVHTLPAAAALRRAFPESRISWVVERSAYAILEGCPIIDEIVVIDTRRWRRSLWRPEVWGETARAVSRLRSRRYDAVFDFQGLFKSAAIAACSGGRKRLGFSNDGLREEGSRFFLTHQIVIDRKTHVIEKNLRLAAAVGARSNGPYEFPVAVSSNDEAHVERLIEENNVSEFAIINPGGGWATKLWPAERFGCLIDAIRDRFDLPSLVTFGPGEEALAQRVVESSRSPNARMAATSLKQFVALARKASLFVGGDTGPLHLAAACRTPIVGIYGPTEPARNGPFDPLDVTVGLDVECRPNCYRRRCPTIECMDMPVAAVMNGVEQRLLQTKLCQLKRSNDILPVGASR